MLLKLLAELDVAFILQVLGLNDFLPGVILDKFSPIACNLDPDACYHFLEIACGKTTNLNESRLEVYVSETPAGTSVINIRHWAQAVKRNKFEWFDYGTRYLNEKHYGSPDPPLYDLSAIKVPTALFYGDNDILADPTDVQQLISELSPDIIVHQNHQSSFAHLDFVWGFDAYDLIYNLDLIGLFEFCSISFRISLKL